MTEHEWDACTDADAMLGFLREGKLPERKAWLFVSAVCRSTWFASSDEAFSRVVEVAERHAEGVANSDEVEEEVFQAGWNHAISGHALAWDAAAWAFSGSKDVHWLAECALRIHESASDGTDLPSHYLRCIFGRIPFRRPRFDPRWRTPMVLSLAQAAYNERVAPAPSRPGWLILDRERLLVLSDALEEAGADEPEILEHLRGPGEHVRGCFAVDWILGKE